MVFPLALAIIASLLSALVNHIDKYLISKVVKNADSRSLVLVSTIIAGGVMTLIYLPICGFRLSLDIQSVLLLFFSAIMFVIMLVFYYKALSRDDTTIVAIMFQTIPVFVLLLSPLFLEDQYIQPLQILGGLLVILASIVVTYEPDGKRFSRHKFITLLITAFAAFAYAIYFIIDELVISNHDFDQTILWYNIALFVVGILILIFIKSFRTSFLKMLKTNGPQVIGLNLVNELLNSFANVFLLMAGAMIPMTLVSFVNQGVQVFMVMILGIIITKLFPKIEKEEITRADIVKRTIAIAICVTGLGLIQFG